MAEIKVRGLSKEVVIRLDSMAKKKNMSRNKYLKESLENDLVLNEMKKFEANYKLSIDKILKELDLNTKLLNVICEELLIDIETIVREEFF